MIIVRVELHSARTREVTELARMEIANTGTGTLARGNYHGRTLRGRNATTLDAGVMQRGGEVLNYPRQAIHIWHLVARMLLAMGYR